MSKTAARTPSGAHPSSSRTSSSRTATASADRSRLLILVVTVSLVAAWMQGATAPPAAAAADARNFNAGMIIADEVFFAPTTMTSAQVQAFLNDKGSACVPSGTGVPCLKDYRETTPSRAATEFCSAYTGATNETAARIIWKSAQACGINPQAIIVILQKEQGLVTASGAGLTEGRYRSAMGFRCPTNQPCDPTYAGFANQVYSGASRFQEYADYPQRFNYFAGRDNTIPYHPDAVCGSSVVFIRNQATAGLYNYTPFQPNQAALDAGYGVGDECSAYGNRNFWLRFQDWFGPTEGEAYNPFGSFDSLVGAAGGLRLRGWAIDRDTTGPIYVWVTVDGGAGRHVLANAPRPDVGAAHPGFGDAHGFDVTIPAAAGSRRVCVTGSNVGIGRHTAFGCRVATALGRSPLGSLDAVTGTPEGFRVQGWGIDPDTTGPVYVWVTVDGAGRHILADAERPDVGGAFPGYGSRHGFDAVVPAGRGSHTVCATVSNVGAGSHTLLGCRTVSTSAGSPFGNLERVAAASGAVEVSGWAIDPDTTGPVFVWVTVDGVGRHVLADGNRPDVGAAYPGFGSRHGFSATLDAARGSRTVCATISNIGEGEHRALGCARVQVA